MESLKDYYTNLFYKLRVEFFKKDPLDWTFFYQSLSYRLRIKHIPFSVRLTKNKEESEYQVYPIIIVSPVSYHGQSHKYYIPLNPNTEAPGLENNVYAWMDYEVVPFDTRHFNMVLSEQSKIAIY